jgi:hypothetical protein
LTWWLKLTRDEMGLQQRRHEKTTKQLLDGQKHLLQAINRLERKAGLPTSSTEESGPGWLSILDTTMDMLTKAGRTVQAGYSAANERERFLHNQYKTDRLDHDVRALEHVAQ